MSSSDYISLKKYRATGGVFTQRDSGNITQRAKINTIRNVINYNASLNSMMLPTQKWFDVAIVNPNICLKCSVINSDNTTHPPIVFNYHTSRDSKGSVKYKTPERFCKYKCPLIKSTT